MADKYFEDLAVGDVIELGSYRPITAEEIISFAEQWDPQPFHTDPEAAKRSIFGGLVASGWHTGVITMRVLVDGLLNQFHSQGSPGVEKIAFVRPVRPGDVLSGRYTVLEASPSASRPGIGKIKARTELLNQDGEVVLQLESWGFFDRRDGADT